LWAKREDLVVDSSLSRTSEDGEGEEIEGEEGEDRTDYGVG